MDSCLTHVAIEIGNNYLESFDLFFFCLFFYLNIMNRGMLVKYLCKIKLLQYLQCIVLMTKTQNAGPFGSKATMYCNL